MGATSHVLGRTPYYVLTGGLAIIFLFPLLWAAVASVSPQAATGQTVGIGLGNYATLFNYGAGLPRFLFNSLFVAFMVVAVTLVVSCFGGYAFARFNFPGRDALFLLTLAILMAPYATVLIPLYVMLHGVGLQNSLIGLSLVLAVFQLPFATYMMRISFEAVPRELDESALMDGCGSFSVLWRILLPLVRPGLITISLFAFLARFLRSAYPAQRPGAADPSARYRHSSPTDDGGDRLRRDGSRRRRDGAALPDPVSVPPAPLRSRLHVRRRQGMTGIA
jgi:multiple sugar transport system permease protein